MGLECQALRQDIGEAGGGVIGIPMIAAISKTPTMATMVQLTNIMYPVTIMVMARGAITVGIVIGSAGEGIGASVTLSRPS